MRTVATGNYLREAAKNVYQGGYRSKGGKGWWNDQRKARLCYIMDRWNDCDKASRVLMVPSPCSCAAIWNRMTETERNRHRQSKDYR